jgi:hypothetical protein
MIHAKDHFSKSIGRTAKLHDNNQWHMYVHKSRTSSRHTVLAFPQSYYSTSQSAVLYPSGANHAPLLPCYCCCFDCIYVCQCMCGITQALPIRLRMLLEIL